jgi:hypothetical protein
MSGRAASAGKEKEARKKGPNPKLAAENRAARANSLSAKGADGLGDAAAENER